MDHPDLSSFIAGLPKAELHVHHVGSASPAIVSELAMRHPGIVPVDTDELRRFFEFRDFAHFVEVYLAVVALIRTDADVRYLTYEVARELATTQQVSDVVLDESTAIVPLAPVSAAGGTAPYSFALTGGTLPRGSPSIRPPECSRGRPPRRSRARPSPSP